MTEALSRWCLGPALWDMWGVVMDFSSGAKYESRGRVTLKTHTEIQVCELCFSQDWRSLPEPSGSLCGAALGSAPWQRAKAGVVNAFPNCFCYQLLHVLTALQLLFRFPIPSSFSSENPVFVPDSSHSVSQKKLGNQHLTGEVGNSLSYIQRLELTGHKDHHLAVYNLLKYLSILLKVCITLVNLNIFFKMQYQKSSCPILKCGMSSQHIHEHAPAAQQRCGSTQTVKRRVPTRFMSSDAYIWKRVVRYRCVCFKKMR